MGNKEQDVADLIKMLRELADEPDNSSASNGITLNKNNSSSNSVDIKEFEEPEEDEKIDFDLPETPVKPAQKSEYSKEQDIKDLMEELKSLGSGDSDSDLIENIIGTVDDTSFGKEIANQTKLEIPRLTKMITGQKYLDHFGNLYKTYGENSDTRKLISAVEQDYLNKFINKVVASNKFDYSNRDRAFASKGLKLACAYLGNIAASEMVSDGSTAFEDVCNTLMSKHANISFNTNDVQYVKDICAIGILTDYISGNLILDEMPSAERMNEYLENEVQMANNSNDGFGTPDVNMGIGFQATNAEVFDNQKTNDTYKSEVDNLKVPEEGSAYLGEEVFTVNNKGKMSLKPRPEQDVILIKAEDYAEASVPKYETAERFKKKLFESRNGTAYEFKKRWDFVLKTIAEKFRDRSTVVRMSLVGSQITVNGKQIRLEGVLGGDYNVQLDDIIDIKRTLKKFPMIKQLILDSNAAQCMIREYGPDTTGIWKMFQENRNLEILGLIPYGESQAVNYNRQTFANTANALERQLKVETFRMQEEQLIASKNTRLHEKSPGYTHKVWKNSKSACVNLFGIVGKSLNDKNPKVMKAMGYSLAGVLVIGLGGMFALGGRTVSGVKAIAGLFK